MTGVVEYILWRGDLPMCADGFNEADAAVLARFAYAPFEYLDAPPRDVFVTIRELAETALSDASLDLDGRWKLRDRELMEAMGESRRFGGLRAGYYFDRFDETLQTQFSAVTVELPDGRYFIAFRGTDNTIVGWKEDLNMSYLCPIPGQETAAEYVRRMAALAGRRLVLGGHSKGGNLAAYAGAFCGAEIQERVDGVYNFDGPGFFDDILESAGYKNLCGKIHTFVPQFSVVGMLLGRGEESAVVHSTENGLRQHDIYSWEILGPRFVHMGSITGGSKFVDSALKGWIAEMTPEQFEIFTDAIYKAMTGANVRTIREMRENPLDTAIGIARSVGDMDDSTRRAVVECVKLLLINARREAAELGRGKRQEK